MSTIKSICRKQETKEELFIGESIEGEKMKESSYYENLVTKTFQAFLLRCDASPSDPFSYFQSAHYEIRNHWQFSIGPIVASKAH